MLSIAVKCFPKPFRIIYAPPPSSEILIDVFDEPALTFLPMLRVSFIFYAFIDPAYLGSSHSLKA
jgi:hypothetical protein